MAGFSLFQNFSLFRSRSNMKAKIRGDSVRHHVVSNPYHAVSVQSPLNTCDAAKELAGKRFLAAEAPPLPLKGCKLATCTCRYVHHDDRRKSLRRAADVTRRRNEFFGGQEQRRSGGRRITDH